MVDPLTIGVFPLGLAGGPDGMASGPPDDFAQIGIALEALQGEGPPPLVRMYLQWFGAHSTMTALAQAEELTASGVPWDLVLSYRDPLGDVAAWATFVSQVVTTHGHQLAAVQVTGEANLVGVPAAADGAFPRAPEALVAGVLAAGEAKRACDATTALGFAVVTEADPAAGSFWPALDRLGGPAFTKSLDYVGLDMYPDVFGPRLELEQIDGVVDTLLRTFRSQALPSAGIADAVPIRICENGWPTGPGRTEARQADVLETILDAVHARRGELNITHWGLFALRDADSSRNDLFHRFGVLRDDYSRKPAFERLRSTIARLR